MKRILSTIGASQNYAFYRKVEGNDLPSIEKAILIKGGAGIISLSNGQFNTPAAVHTDISDEDHDLLQTHNVFKKHVANGFIKVVTVNTKITPKTIADLVPKDGSAQMTQADYETLRTEDKTLVKLQNQAGADLLVNTKPK